MTIGQNFAEQVALKMVGGAATLVGDANHATVADLTGAVATFSGPNAAAYFSILSDAARGTAIKFLQPGVYDVTAEVAVVITGGDPRVVRAGITYDAPAAQLNTDPDPGGASVFDTAVVEDSAPGVGLATRLQLHLHAEVQVRQLEANDLTTPLGLLRLQWSDDADGAPVIGSIEPTLTLVRIVRVAPLDS